MASIPKRVSDRLAAGVKKFQPILASAKARDVNESDTVVIVTDVLADVFGYDKYSEVTSEFSIRGTYCDLALKLDGKCQALIEVKAIGTELRDAHLKQCIDYAANQGVEWAILTNGIDWKIYHVIFAKPIDQVLVAELTFASLNTKDEAHMQLMFLFTREGWAKSAVGDYKTQREALSRFFIGATVISDAVVSVIRRELKRLSPDVRIEADQIKEVLVNEVLKRDVLEGDKAISAKKAIGRAAARVLRTAKAIEAESAAPAADIAEAPTSAQAPSLN